jgi:predicted membrane channel-forming protein YqfA (hemolysin III family)
MKSNIYDYINLIMSLFELLYCSSLNRDLVQSQNSIRSWFVCFEYYNDIYIVYTLCYIPILVRIYNNWGVSVFKNWFMFWEYLNLISNKNNFDHILLTS